MITKEEAIELGNTGIGKRVYCIQFKNKDGSFTDCKINGKCKTWKTRPFEYRLPVKVGFREYSYITDYNNGYWSLHPSDFLTLDNASPVE